MTPPQGAPLYVVAPELLVVSDWERHAVVADLRGSFTGYTRNLTPNADGTPLSAPLDVDRPNFVGHIDGRLDASRDTRLTAQGRLLVATDNPGSPNVQAGLQRYPIYTTVGGTFGFDQNFNRLQVSAGATVDRTDYQWSKLTDGTSSSNDDRNYSQYGGVGRVSYDLIPGLKPFGEIVGNVRAYDLLVDRNGYQRSSSGGNVRAGTTFELSRLLTGEVAIGWTARTYEDPRLLPLQGLLTSASLVWTVTPLTTAKFFADTQIAETTLPGVSGVLTHTYTFEVDHDFRRWLTGIGRFTYGTLDYQGDNRTDKIFTLSGDLIYKLNRNIWIKGTAIHSVLDFNLAGLELEVDRGDAGREIAELISVSLSAFFPSGRDYRVRALVCRRLRHRGPSHAIKIVALILELRLAHAGCNCRPHGRGAVCRRGSAVLMETAPWLFVGALPKQRTRPGMTISGSSARRSAGP